MSDSSHVTPCAAHASLTTSASVWSRLPSTSAPSRSKTTSVSESLRNATVTWRCSASPRATARWLRSGTGTYSARTASAGAGPGSGSSTSSPSGGSRADEEVGALALPADPPALQRVRGPRADQDLTRLGGVLQLERPRGRRPERDQLAVRALDEEELARAGVDAGGHAQVDRPDRAHRRAGRLDEPLHLGGRVAGARFMLVALEQHQQGVPAELEHVAAVAAGDSDQALEHAADDEDQLLGAGAPLGGESLGEGREAGEVDRDQRSVEPPIELPWVVARPADDERRQVGAQAGSRLGEGTRLGHRSVARMYAAAPVL